ncbi:hypothetical protein FUAX_15150 [Fulvitalea axinellae]|uniref:Uncharacterized protein n=1 Tax=Fulvitalea axinellae TaxID=1182444 RepID=A0AAU9CZF5_9BACT|nr:hypothetical protein FUAX_15150 [Fulvitalea axinellae]
MGNKVYFCLKKSSKRTGIQAVGTAGYRHDKGSSH